MAFDVIACFIFDLVFRSFPAYDISIFPWFLKQARSQLGWEVGSAPHLPDVNKFIVPKPEKIYL